MAGSTEERNKTPTVHKEGCGQRMRRKPGRKQKRRRRRRKEAGKENEERE